MKFKLILITIFILSMVLVSACGLLPQEDERLRPPIREAREVSYVTETAKLMDIDKNMNLFAQWKAKNKRDFAFTDFNAPFLEYRVSVGDMIKPGDILAVLDIGEIDKELRDMEINFQRQKLQYERMLEKYNAGTVSGYDLRIAELDYENITNKYNDLKAEKASSILVSDIYGEVTHLMDIDKGDMVRTGVKIVKAVEDDELVLEATSSTLRNSTIKVGDYVRIESNNQEIDGIISERRTTSVLIQPAEMLDSWEMGSTVKAVVPLENARGVIVINRNAIKTIGGRSYVRILIDGVPVERQVQLGISSGRNVEIVSGIQAGDEVILN